MTYAEATAFPSLTSLGPVKYRAVKFACCPDTKDYDIVRALIVHCDVKGIERVQPMPGAGNWVVVFKKSSLAEQATEGFTLKEQRIQPKLIADRYVTATVCFVPPDISTEEISAALSVHADVIDIKELHMRDFPDIKNGKQRVVLKPRGELPSYFSVGDTKASLFFAGRVACCPYCEGRDHLGRDCGRKREKRCFECGELGHIKRHCLKDLPGLETTSTPDEETPDTETATAPEKLQDDAETDTETPEKLQVQLPSLPESEEDDSEKTMDEMTGREATKTPTETGTEANTEERTTTKDNDTEGKDTEDKETEGKDADETQDKNTPEEAMEQNETGNRKRAKEETPPPSPSKQRQNGRNGKNSGRKKGKKGR